MSTKWQRVAINLPKDYSPEERQAIAQDIIDFIRKRSTDEQVDKNGKPFARYSKSYVKSLNFKIAGKDPGSVDLTLSGDMLGALDLISDSSGKVIIGYQNGSNENAIADGNIRGTYGKSRPIGPRRDFLGISQSDLRKILDRYPLEDRERSRENARESNSAQNAANGSDNVDTEEPGDD